MMPLPNQGCILIPFHHRNDLLLPLLEHLKDLPVCVVDDAETQQDWTMWQDLHPAVKCVRSGGSSGFTAAINKGLEFVDALGFQRVLILNDDAWLSLEDIETLFTKSSGKRLVSPVIESNGVQYFGVKLSSWGRVQLTQHKSDRIDALLGTSLVMPTSFRFDTRFHHGFEDIHLTHQSKMAGYELRVIDSVVCRHIGGGSLDSQSPVGLKYSIYGHLCLYNSLRKLPIIWSLYVMKILKDPNRNTLFQIYSIHQGAVGWVWSAIAARIDSSKLGSSNVK